MSKKCLGCGAFLQTLDSELEGYVNVSKLEEAMLCERCFRIKNYGEYKVIVKDNNDFVKILKEINKTDSLVILVVDLFNMPENFNVINENMHNPILLVLTKRDLLPKSIYEVRLLNYMDKFELNYVDRLIISSVNNYNLDLLIDKIKKYKKGDNVYIVGNTNAGKSTLINKLIYNYSENISNITTSLLPSTTLNNINIKLDDDLVLIDTPGLLVNNSVDNYVDVDILKKITPKKTIKPISYQIKVKQWIVVEDLFALECADNNIVMFFANNLKIERYFNHKKLNLKEYILEVKENSDLVIAGFGFIKFVKQEKIKIFLLDGVKFFVRESLI